MLRSICKSCSLRKEYNRSSLFNRYASRIRRLIRLRSVARLNLRLDTPMTTCAGILLFRTEGNEVIRKGYKRKEEPLLKSVSKSFLLHNRSSFLNVYMLVVRCRFLIGNHTKAAQRDPFRDN